MLAKCVLLLLCYHHLLGGAVSEFTPTVYGIESTAECGQYNPLNDEQLNQVLRQVQQRLPTSTLSDPQLNQNITRPVKAYSIASHQLPQATTTSLLPTAILLHWSTVTWRGPTVEEREAGRGWLMST